MRIQVEHVRFENDCWKRLLEFIRLENSYQKTRLAEVIRLNTGEPEFLEQAEFFHNYYIQQDTHLSLLRQDLNTFGRLIERERFLDGMIVKEVQHSLTKLRREVQKLDNDFREMREKFNRFVEANM